VLNATGNIYLKWGHLDLNFVAGI